jgi:adenine-specific DNA-methyltransferase
MISEFTSDLLILYENLINNRLIDIDGFKGKWNINGSIGETYQKLSKIETKKDLGSFYTPFEIVEYMVEVALKDISYESNTNLRILDPSCGGGYFLKAVLNNLREKAKGLMIPNIDSHILKNNIFGYDIDIIAKAICVIELYEATGYLSENIEVKDFLMDQLSEFDIIIGNPPYMGHKVLTGDYREKLYEIYGEVFFDKGDISYCFIKKSIDLLKPFGKLIFFTSRYILEAMNGTGIREFLKNKGAIISIIDFYGVRVVKGAGVDNIIFDFAKNSKAEYIDVLRLKPSAKEIGGDIFKDIFKENFFHIKRMRKIHEELNSKGWIFSKDNEALILNKINGIELKTFCESFQGIITGCDKAFILKNEDIEKSCMDNLLLKPWIKSKNVKKFMVTVPNEVIIYSDLIKDETKHYIELKYIKKKYKELMNRRECKTGKRKWYQLQWGRKISLFEESKIIYPYKASSNRFAIDRGNCFSADVYALKIMKMFEQTFSYEFLVGVLNSSIYEFYIKSIAKKLGDNLYEYYPNKIMTLKIPEYIKKIEELVISQEDNYTEKIDRVLNEHFGITEEEYEVIKGWCM